ncbi:hypothetical protein OH460_07685 [Vibrio sp. Makdt]|uniref:hypothetical protein n=1 Tax=Vibrio sp. Makdt TaxID=2998828 RepID=UPI0022CD650B|nr:hypothetical protein [Vibrio sp. Makdt]MDA0152177.1 hypothetical protein [Vibrio sp. Makdt]
MNQVHLFTNPTQKPDVQPKRGDIVIPLSGLKIGQHGMIDTFYHENDDDHTTTISIGFHVSAYKVEGNFNSVQCSGGPFTGTTHDQLTLIGTKQQQFWDFRNGAGAGMGVQYTEEVNVWTYKPTEELRICLNRSFDSYEAMISHDKTVSEKASIIQTEVQQTIKATNEVDFYKVCRGGYLITDKKSDWSNGFNTDYKFKVIFSSYNRNQHICIAEHEEPVGCGYLYTGDGFAFRNKVELNAFIEAYNLTISDIRGPWDQLMLIPNINIDEWKQLNITALKAPTSA